MTRPTFWEDMLCVLVYLAFIALLVALELWV